MNKRTHLYAGFELYAIQGVARKLKGKVFTGYHSNGIAEFTAGDKLHDKTPVVFLDHSDAEATIRCIIAAHNAIVASDHVGFNTPNMEAAYWHLTDFEIAHYGVTSWQYQLT